MRYWQLRNKRNREWLRGYINRDGKRLVKFTKERDLAYEFFTEKDAGLCAAQLNEQTGDVFEIVYCTRV